MSELKEKFEKMLDNSGSSPKLPTESGQPSIEICHPPEKNKGDNKLYILICIIVIALILFKYNDIMDLIFGGKNNLQVPEHLEEFEDEYDEHCIVEEEEKPGIHEDEPKNERKKIANEFSTKSNSKTYRKMKDPLFQEFE